MCDDVASSTVTHRTEIERFVCEREGRRAGFLSYTLERRKTFVIDVVEVAPEYRRDGVPWGERLLLIQPLGDGPQPFALGGHLKDAPNDSRLVFVDLLGDV